MTTAVIRSASNALAVGLADDSTEMNPVAPNETIVMLSHENLKVPRSYSRAASQTTPARRNSTARMLEGSRPRADAELVAVLPAEDPLSLNRSIEDRTPSSSMTNAPNLVAANSPRTTPTQATRGSTILARSAVCVPL